MKRLTATNGDEAAQALAQINWKVVAFDTETTDLSYSKLQAVGYSVTDGKTVVYVDLWDKPEGIKLLGEFLKQTKFLIGHNIVFDLKVLHKYGIMPEHCELFDTMVAHHLIDENSEHGLKYLAETILGAETVDYKTVEKAGHHTKEFYEYAQNDAVWTWELCHIFKNQLADEDKLVRLFRDVEMPFQWSLVDMETNGVLVDLEKVTTISTQLRYEILALECQMLDLLGVKYQKQMDFVNGLSIISPVNFNSSKQLAAIFDKLGIEITEKTKSGAPSIGKATMQKLKGAHPFVDLLDKYKSMQKLLSAFFEPLPTMVDSDGRVRPHFRDTGTATGRLSCSNPNIQQLPRDNELVGISTRSCFVAPKGKKILAADYSQQETRVMADLSGDENLIKLLNDGGDIHLISAKAVFGIEVPIEVALNSSHPEYNALKKKYSKERTDAKPFSFALPYGAQGGMVSAKYGVSREEGQRMVDNFYKDFPQLKAAMDNARKTVEKQEYVETYVGRKRHFPNHKQTNYFTQAFNFLIQSYGADLIRMSCNKIRDYAKKNPQYGIKLIMTVHDEVVIEVNEEYAKRVARDVEQLMESCASMCVPLKAEAHYGDDYASAK